MNVKIIAEIGINHNGKLNLAKRLIDVAKKAGANCVKFQSFNPNNMVTKKLNLANYQKKNLSNKNNKMYQMLNKYKLSFKSQIILSNYCKRKKIEFISSPFDIESLYFLTDKIRLKSIKIASGEITNFPLLKEIARSGKKIILSSGMSSLKEISDALKLLIKYGTLKKNITLLQCNSSYPSQLKDLNLRAMLLFKKKFKINIGLSDHSSSIYPPMIAIALGASVIEKHLTLNKKMSGPDHKSSMSPGQFKIMVDGIKDTQIMLGSYEKKVLRLEKKNLYFARKSIVAKKKINKGDKFNNYNLTTKRPGGGISPMLWNKIIGKRSKRTFYTDDLIKRK